MTRVLLLLAGFAAAVGVRVVVGGDAVRTSLLAGLAFAGCLLLLALAARTRLPVTRKAIGYGFAGALVICLPVLVGRLLTLEPLHGTEGLARWSAVVALVVLGEELFLRGALHEAVEAVAGAPAAVVVGAACFALLHVPMYGWEAVPLDLAVGLVLGWLRVATGSPAAPFVAHLGADLVGWFVR